MSKIKKKLNHTNNIQSHTNNIQKETLHKDISLYIIKI